MLSGGGYSWRVNYGEIGCRLAKADGRRGGLLINGAARYLNDRHRALQLRHPAEGQACFAKAMEDETSARVWRCVGRASNMPFYQTNPPFLEDILYASVLRSAVYSGKLRRNSVGSFWKTNPPEGVFEGGSVAAGVQRAACRQTPLGKRTQLPQTTAAFATEIQLVACRPAPLRRTRLRGVNEGLGSEFGVKLPRKRRREKLQFADL